ncbi:MAG: GC-type dockerin domain-anchored protein [Phycisphaerales bacterium]|nr:GC-type dockerin domain-anchored protein [Phycisphaerales bacterium]
MQSKMFVLALAVAAGSAFAQNSIVDNIAGTFVDISTMGSVNSLVAFDSDDASYAFTSSVTNGIFASTTVRVCTNGYAQWGGATGGTAYFNGAIASGTASPMAPVDSQCLMPLWDDQYVRPGGGANLHWIEGPASSFGLPSAAGNVLIIQWTNVEHYFTSTGLATYQIQVFQNPLGGSVAAQMLYQNVNFGNAAWDNGASATIGFASGTTGGAASINNVQWAFNSAGSVNNGDVLSLLIPTASVPPSGVGSSVAAGSSVLLRVSTASGFNPSSSSITVTGNLSTSMGGPASVAFQDDGLNGDVTASDGTYSYLASYPSGTTDGTAFTVPFTVTDNLARSSSGSINFTADTAGDLPAMAAVLPGSGDLSSITGVLGANDVDMYKINICDMANFSATTQNTAPTIDTQLFLFNADGTGVVMNDDNPAGTGGLWSRIDNTTGFIVANGTYYLAISRYDMDPTSGGLEIWADTPFGAQRQPDGANSSGIVDAWNGANANTNGYLIELTGTCYPSSGPICGLADVGGVGGAPGADNHLDNNDFVVFIDYFFNQNPIADQGSTGGVAGADGVYDNNDFIVFIDNFFNAPASCR